MRPRSTDRLRLPQRKSRRTSVRRRRIQVPAVHLHNATNADDFHPFAPQNARWSPAKKADPLRLTLLRNSLLRHLHPSVMRNGSTRLPPKRSRRSRDLRMRRPRRLRFGTSLLSRSWKNRDRRRLRASLRMHRQFSSSALPTNRHREEGLSCQ